MTSIVSRDGSKRVRSPDTHTDTHTPAQQSNSPIFTCEISSLQLTDKFVHKFVKNFPECRPDGFCSSGIFLLNPLCFSQVSSYGGYLRYRLYTQTMRGDVLSLPAEASRPDILLKVLDSPESWVSLQSNQNVLTANVVVLQGNQMTLVFMEREYSTPEEPHLGIVHIVEVGRFLPISSNGAKQSCY